MNSLKGKVTFITGASTGIGKACAYIFAREGSNLVISARRIELLKDIANDIKSKYSVELYFMKMDVSNYSEVKNEIESLPSPFSKIDILINNAGLARGLGKLHTDNTSGWEEMIDTNIKGLLYVTREIVGDMVERKSGHVINIGSIAGHEAYPKAAVYCSTKYAVNAITKSLRMDVVEDNVRVSSIDPGLVETDFSKVRFYGDEGRAKNTYTNFTPLSANDVAEAVLFCATRPEHANISEMIIMPTAQASPFVVNKSKSGS